MKRDFKEKLVLNLYLAPFYFVVYMMFFYDPIGDIWEEKEFNRTVQYKSLEEIYQLFGEPQNFQIRDNFIILDYYGLVYHKEKKRENIYQFVRLLFPKNKTAVLPPKNIFYQK